MSAGGGGRTEDTRKEDLATGSHQCKACWFPLIVPYHREVTDREVVLWACLPPNSTGQKGKKKGKSVPVGRQADLTFCLKPVVLQFGEPQFTYSKRVVMEEVPIHCPEVLSAMSNPHEASGRVSGEVPVT